MRTVSDPAPAIAGSGSSVLARDEARRRHYGVFYGLEPAPPGAGLVLGNCQAESLRIVLDGAVGPTVRVPPVHELEADDLPHLDRLLGAADVVVLQPVRDDYRGLPLGTAQVRGRVRAGCRVAMVPVVRYTGLHPAWMPLNVPGVDESPPIVAYHDVRTLCRVAGLPVADALSAAPVRELGAESVAELRRRERAAGTVPIADLFDAPDFGLLRTPNHPANGVFLPLGARVLEALGRAGPPTDPGRPLLASVEAPREEWVLDAWGLADAPRTSWLVAGREVDPAEIAAAHEAWYRAHPAFVRGALDRLAALVARWRAA